MCRWCHRRCGDREFCCAECYEEWLEAQAEAADDPDGPPGGEPLEDEVARPVVVHRPRPGERAA